MKLRFYIPGTPVSPAPDKFVARRGRVYRYTPDRNSTYIQRIRASWRTAGGESIEADQPVSIRIAASFAIPPSSTRRQRELMMCGVRRPARHPDADSLSSLVCAALVGVAFPDRRQIARLELVKRYTDQPDGQLTIEVSTLDQPVPTHRYPDRRNVSHVSHSSTDQSVPAAGRTPRRGITLPVRN